jgi:hypothetical protein
MVQIIYNRDSLPKVRPSDFDLVECYLEQGRRAIFAANMLTFAYGIFNRAAVIKKLDIIAEMHRTGESQDQLKFTGKLKDVLLDSLMDNIRNSVSFENYFKARLLLNDLVIHSIKPAKNMVHSKIQWERPVEIKELIA